MMLVETWPAVDDPTGGVLLTLSVSIGAMPVKPAGKTWNNEVLKELSYRLGTATIQLSALCCYCFYMFLLCPGY